MCFSKGIKEQEWKIVKKVIKERGRESGKEIKSKGREGVGAPRPSARLLRSGEAGHTAGERIVVRGVREIRREHEIQDNS